MIDEKVIIVHDDIKGYGIFRSLPLLYEIYVRNTGLHHVVTSVYRNIEKYMFILDYEFNYAHFTSLSVTPDTILLIYVLSEHEQRENILSRTLWLKTKRKIIITNDPCIEVSYGKTLPDMYGVTPLKYKKLWENYILTRNNICNLNTYNYALCKISRKENSIRQVLFNNTNREEIRKWLLKLSKVDDIENYLRYWFERKTCRELSDAIKSILRFWRCIQ